MGHIGLKPQKILQDSGYKVAGKTEQSAIEIVRDAIALERVGVFSLVLEGIPAELAALITEKITIPTIGIGAGSMCDGQIQVFHDLLDLVLMYHTQKTYFAENHKFVRLSNLILA